MKEPSVKVWREQVLIPTYEAGLPDKNPMFFENRVYQGSSGVVYPNPVIEKIYDEKIDKEYIGLFIENEYLKIMILPELGGRIQMAYDKIKQRHFVYYNQVIKPALVGLCGPWISGGIEFNWPQHHRPSTFEPVDFCIEENLDGSKTIWINEIERMSGTKGMAGFILHPGKAYLEIKVKLFNRTALPQTFLWWANPAVKVNADYQSVFPPDVNAVFDHGKRDVSDFPIATGTYYKVNYAPGTDISRYKNIPVPTSYMAIESDYDFLGGYEYDADAGVLHVANHFVSPGKKQWTWGNGDFGLAWDRNLTDEDGPYVELMAGVFTDNQPDFSWLMPYEEKTFTQYFVPYRELGLVKNATKDFLIGLEQNENQIHFKLLATSNYIVRVQLECDHRKLFDEKVNVGPDKVFSKSVFIEKNMNIKNSKLIVLDDYENEILHYNTLTTKKNVIPEPAKPVLAPKDIETNEKLFLAGLHLEQYRHATYSPVPYYEEALKRDASDIRNNNALGLWYLRRGQFEKSELFFKKAIETLTEKNPNPYDGEPFYNLGLSLKAQKKNNEAYKYFYKGVWNSAWQHSCYFSLAQIDCINRNFSLALEHIQQSLDRNVGNGKAYVIKIAALRKLNMLNDAMHACGTAIEKDMFNLGVYFEQSLINRELKNDEAAEQALNQLRKLSRNYEQNYIEYALDYAAGGLYREAIDMLNMIADGGNASVSPMVWYYLAWLYYQVENKDEVLTCLKKAQHVKGAYCFPNRLQDIEVLELAIRLNKNDAKAPYYLGNLWYDKRQYEEAVLNWRLSSDIESSFPTVFRNLGIASFNKLKDPQNALNEYEKAFMLNTSDARVLMELDQLYKRVNKDPQMRLAFLENYLSIVEDRDDLYLERVALYNYLGKCEIGYELIMQRKFHPWEGGEGKVSGQFCYSLIELAKKNLQSGNFHKAIDFLKQTDCYPDNLGEGKLFGTQENDIHYWIGIAHESMGNRTLANEYYTKATQGNLSPFSAVVYNDQQPDKIFYQGLAWLKLKEIEKANEIFNELILFGTEHMNDETKIDYFAVSLPDLLIFDDDFNKRNRIHCHYMMGLGFLGLNDFKKAKKELKKVTEENAMHFGCRTHLQLLEIMENSMNVIHS